MKERKVTFWIVRTFYWISIWHWIRLEEDCPFNQAEFPYAFHSLSVSRSWVWFQKLKIHIFSASWHQRKTAYSDAQISKQHSFLFFKYTKHMIPQDLCIHDFALSGNLFLKIFIWSTWLIYSLSSCLYVKVSISVRSSLSFQCKLLSTLQHFISSFSALFFPIVLKTI